MPSRQLATERAQSTSPWVVRTLLRIRTLSLPRSLPMSTLESMVTPTWKCYEACGF